MTETEAELLIAVNGEDMRVPAGSTVADLVASRGLKPSQVAIEINKDIVPRLTHADRKLEPGDRVEIVTLVGGG